jgi:hypothetical protein
VRDGRAALAEEGLEPIELGCADAVEESQPEALRDGDSGVSNIAYVPATSIQVAPDAGWSAARASTKCVLAVASARSSRRASARSANGHSSRPISEAL